MAMKRKEYEMAQADLDKLLDACKPVPYMVFGGRPPRSPQENANDAWAELGSLMGFDHMTAQPTGKGDRFFSAMPTEHQGTRMKINIEGCVDYKRLDWLIRCAQANNIEEYTDEKTLSANDCEIYKDGVQAGYVKCLSDMICLRLIQKSKKGDA